MENHSQTAAFLWSIADLLRGDFKQSQYGRIILPFTLLRRMECVLAPTKSEVINQTFAQEGRPDAVREMFLLRAAGGLQFFNASPLTLGTLSDTQTAADLMSYVQAFSKDAREIFEHFHFEDFVQQLESANLLYQVVQRFAATDLSPEFISNFGMGIIFEELIRKFAESSNETAGEHFTPRDIVHLTTSLVITDQDHKLAPNSIVTIYDPTAGTGGFLSEGDEYIQSISDKVSVSLHGQELNPESYAICKADMLIKGQDVASIKLGNTLSNDQLAGKGFDFMLSNPPFGVEWKKVQKQITDEHSQKGFDGRFGPGLPRVSDGSLLFLLHLVSKMRDPRDGGSRIGIILNGSPLFTGGAGSGESEIRRYLLQNDLVEAIVALPTDMFYNTGIATYVWILSNHKAAARQSKMQLIDGSQLYAKMRKSLGSKRQYITEDQISELVRLYGSFEHNAQSKIFPIDAFGYRRITVERPLRFKFDEQSEKGIEALKTDDAYRKLPEEIQWGLSNILVGMAGHCKEHGPILSRTQFRKEIEERMETYAPKGVMKAKHFKALEKLINLKGSEGEVCRDNKGNPEPDPDLRDNENVPLGESVYDYFQREVIPHVPDAWIDESKTDALDGEVGIVGFEIPFNRHFYVFQPPRPLAQIDSDLKACTDRIKQMIEELSA
tara:strand:+ start:25435 stop:27432 length:1998 start_codon:yes stop_codon:yes gene_type:complete